MYHSHSELIEEPQWVSYCVENECSFTDHFQGYVCQTHWSKHVCSGSSCSSIRTMATGMRHQTVSSESSCPVEALLVFHKPQVEFRGPRYAPDRGDPVELGYGTVEHNPRKALCCSEVDDHLVLKASLSVMVALFSTALTKDFARQYAAVQTSRGPNASTSVPRSCSWMAKISETAETIQFGAKAELPCSEDVSSVVKDAVLKSAVAISTLFDSRDAKIRRFMKKLTCRYNDKHGKRADFYTMVVMLAVCFFPYLQHRVLGELFNNRTLVTMFFDRTRTRHNQWSTLSAQIHMHVKTAKFVQRVLSGADLARTLPAVVTATLEMYVSNGRCCNEAMSNDQTAGARERDEHAEAPPPPVASLRKKKPLTGKRRSPCVTGHYETCQGRPEEKSTRLRRP